MPARALGDACRRMVRRVIALSGAAIIGSGIPVVAQQTPMPDRTIAPPLADPVVPGAAPIAVIDQERLYRDSLFGARVQEELAAEIAALEAENERLLAELVAREAELTDLRPTLPPDEFRERADAFDRDVEEIRAAQELKSRQIGQLQDRFRQLFFEQAFPLLPGLMRQIGALVLIDTRSVVMALDAADITTAAIAAIDRVLGDGDDIIPPLPLSDGMLPPADDMPPPGPNGGGEAHELTLP